MTDIDFAKIGRRIRIARMEKGLNQTDLGVMVGCSNNHMSHIETGQTKVSLSMLFKLACVLEKDINYFFMDMPYAATESIIDQGIVHKLKQCDALTLLSVSKILDVLMEEQTMRENITG